MNPYTVLKIAKSCTDAEVEEAYQKRLEEYPAEKYPREAALIRKAYDALETAEERAGVHSALLDVPYTDVQEILLMEILSHIDRIPLSKENFRAMIADL